MGRRRRRREIVPAALGCVFLLTCESRERHALLPSQPPCNKYYEKLVLSAGMRRRNVGKVWTRPILGQLAGPEFAYLDHAEKVPTGNGLLLPEEEGKAKHLGKTKDIAPTVHFTGYSWGAGCVCGGSGV